MEFKILLHLQQAFWAGLIAKVSSSCFVAVGLFFKWGKKHFILKQIIAGSFVLRVSLPLFMQRRIATTQKSVPELPLISMVH